MKVAYLFNNFEEVFQRTGSQKVIIGVLIITLVVFAPVFTTSEFLSYDDSWYILKNENITNFSWESVRKMFATPFNGQYSPVAEIYNALVYWLFGENARAFKICALLVHLLNVVLLFKIFSKLFENKLLVSMVVLFFSIHPMQVETISWLSVIFRNAVFFMFMGYFFYLKYLEDNYKKYRLIPVLLCYVIALLTKEQAILFPVGLFLINLIKFNSVWNKRLIIEMIFCAVITLVFGLITIEVTKAGGPSIINRDVSFYEKIGLSLKTFIMYGYNFLFPVELSFSYPYPDKKSTISILTIFGAIALLGMGFYISFRNKIFRFGFLWVLGFLSLGLVFAFFHLRDTYMADRYAYLAVVGFSVLLYQFLYYLKERILDTAGFAITSLVFIIFFSIISFNRVHVFRNDKNLWTQATNVNPQNAFAFNNLGYFYKSRGNLDTAKVFYKKAIDLMPMYYKAHTNITKVYYDKKQYDSALYHISKAISIKPKYERAYENRAVLYSVLGKNDLYLKDLNKLIELSPGNRKFLINRSKFYFKAKRYGESLQDALELLKKPNSQDGESFYLAGHNFLILKKYKEADIFLSKAIALDLKKSKNYYLRSVARVSLNKWGIALKDALRAKELGYKVNNDYLVMLAREVKKRNK